MNVDETYIFLDLDETLIQTLCHKTDNNSRINFELDGDGYSVMKRPSMLPFIEQCRRLAPTRILTNSVEDYAYKINEICGLGFKEDEIHSRYDYLDFVPCDSGWGASVDIEVVIDHLHLRNAILVDNLYFGDPSARHKMDYLGITDDRYIYIRSFDGKDPVCFGDELVDIMKEIESLII
jgi:hypothetical protein